MKKYIDRSLQQGCIGVIGTDNEGNPIEFIQAGTIISSIMPIKHKNEYLEIEEKHKIHFIFVDNIPQIDFYTVPLIDIFAIDYNGGYFGSVGNMIELEDLETPICYINKNKEIFKVANNFKEFIFDSETATERLNQMEPLLGITFYSSLKEAKEQLDFIEIKH